MLIPTRGREHFIRRIADECRASQTTRSSVYNIYESYARCGSADPSRPAPYNKLYAILDDVASLLFSPVSLRFHIGDAETPSVLQESKNRIAASKLHAMTRRSDTDTLCSDIAMTQLVKGSTILKQSWMNDGFYPQHIQPESFGVLNEHHTALDSDMDAFCWTRLLTPYQLDRLLRGHDNRQDITRRIRRQSGPSKAEGTGKQVLVGQMQPFTGPGIGAPNTGKGLVNWMTPPPAMMTQAMRDSLYEMDEVWIWDDLRGDWGTFQIVGDVLITGKDAYYNLLAVDPESKKSAECLKGEHPFIHFCVNRVDNYFWGRSEVSLLAALQSAINYRVEGIYNLLRQQEDPAMKFLGTTAPNSAAYERFRKPGGWIADQNPTAKIERDNPVLPAGLFETLAEYERMMDELSGLPPIAKGRGEAGVRGQGHAETLIRMFSPRFKDRALLFERSVEALGGLQLDLARAHCNTKMTAWVPAGEAGVEGSRADIFEHAPAPGLVPVSFGFHDLDGDVSVTVDSHSSSPAFSADAKSILFDLFKIGAASREQVIDHVDAPDPEGMIAGVERREAAEAMAKQQENETERLKLVAGGKKR